MRRLLPSRPSTFSVGGGSRTVTPLKAALALGRRAPSRHQSTCAASQTAPPSSSLQHHNGRPEVFTDCHLSRPVEHINAALRIYHASPEELSSRDIRHASIIASWEDARITTVTAQLIIYLSPNLSPKLLRVLQANKKWEERLTKVLDQNFKSDHVFHWARILMAKTPDAQVQEYINHPGPKPVFLLNYILQHALGHSSSMSVKSLYELIDYCKKSPNEALRSPRDAGSNSTDFGVTNLNTIPIKTVLRRLLALVRRIRPQAAVDVADFAVVCLEKLAPGSLNTDVMYRFRCSIFNFVLRDLAIPPRRNPYRHRNSCWQGILKLLSFSSGLEKPLLIERESYRAIRDVLVGVPKADAERDSATALKRTWPPYRILRNGVEEDTPLEEFASRSVKAGSMMQSAGYAKELVDMITDVLGGEDPDGTPTIQTRSVIPRRSSQEISELDSLANIWAAQVRATRNAEEAWQAFQRAPRMGMMPTAVVFEQMIHKLLANHAEDHHHNLPGDGRETSPFDDLNYSDFEKTRLLPPTLERLISIMKGSHVPLEGKSLRAVLRHAHNCKDAISLIRQSSLPLSQQNTLERLLRIRMPDSFPEFDARYRDDRPAYIHEIPRELIQVMVELLGRFHPTLTPAGLSAVPRSHLKRIHVAREVAATYAVRGDPQLWESILKTLSRSNIILRQDSLAANATQVLALSGEVLAEAQSRCGITLDMFQSFAWVVRKTMEFLTPSLIESAQNMDPEEVRSATGLLLTFAGDYTHPPAASTRPLLRDWPFPHETPNLSRLLDAAQGVLKAMWYDFSAARSSGGNVIAVTADAVSVNNYMKVLASVGDHGEMQELLKWTLKNIAAIAGNSDGKGELYLRRALYAFRAFAEPMLPSETVTALRREIEEPRGRINMAVDIHWPSDEEVFNYTQNDRFGHRQKLVTLLRCVKDLQVDKNDGGEGGAPREEEKKVPVRAWRPHARLGRHISTFKEGLAERYSTPGFALYKREWISWEAANQAR